uniref:Uncharacterized protein n=1 Tax=Arundo donax TaxID=35708 RepID=A0A0A9FP52_ARUDO
MKCPIYLICLCHSKHMMSLSTCKPT